MHVCVQSHGGQIPRRQWIRTTYRSRLKTFYVYVFCCQAGSLRFRTKFTTMLQSRVSWRTTSRLSAPALLFCLLHAPGCSGACGTSAATLQRCSFKICGEPAPTRSGDCCKSTDLCRQKSSTDKRKICIPQGAKPTAYQSVSRHVLHCRQQCGAALSVHVSIT